MDKRDIGSLGERIAKEELENKGYKVLAMNYKCKFGEIDIVAEDKGVLVGVEVKTRTNFNYGQAIESIDENKLHRIYKSLMDFAKSKERRIDIVEVTIIHGKIDINILKNVWIF